MTELYIYRFIMFWLVLAAALLGVKTYGDYRVHRFLVQTQTPLPPPLPANSVPGYPHGQVPGQPSIAYPPLPISQPTFLPQPASHARSLPPGVVAAGSGVNPAQQPPQSARQPPLPATAGTLPPARPTAGRLHTPDLRPQAGVPNHSIPAEEALPAEDPTVAEISAIQKRLGGSRVAAILSSDGGWPAGLDSEQVFLQTLQKLTAADPETAQGRAFSSPTTPNAVKPSLCPFPQQPLPLTASERQVVEQHLRRIAERLQSRDPEKSAAWDRLADRLGPAPTSNLPTR